MQIFLSWLQLKCTFIDWDNMNIMNIIQILDCVARNSNRMITLQYRTYFALFIIYTVKLFRITREGESSICIWVDLFYEYTRLGTNAVSAAKFLVTRRKIEIYISRSLLPVSPVSTRFIALIIIFLIIVSDEECGSREEAGYLFSAFLAKMEIILSYIASLNVYEIIFFHFRLSPPQRFQARRIKWCDAGDVKSLAYLPDYRGRVWRAWRRIEWPRDSATAFAPLPLDKR